MVNVALSWDTAVALVVGLEGICLGVLPCMVARLLTWGKAVLEALNVKKGPSGALLSDCARTGMLAS